MNLFRFIPGYQSSIYEADKEPLLLLFLSFLITFALARLYTRLARRRGWGSGSAGGVHLHHVVVGVVLTSIAGIVAFTQFGNNAVVFDVCAILFGVGLALTLDEFAMIFHLKDVYWAEEGRTSIDALILGVAGAGLLLVSSSPYTSSGETKPGQDLALELHIAGFDIKVAVWIDLLACLFFATIVFLKKKPFVGLLALFLVPFGIVGAIRLAKPGSPWARWFYDPDKGNERTRERRGRKRVRSSFRFTEGRSGRFERWFSDLLGGTPGLSQPVTNQHPAHEQQPRPPIGPTTTTQIGH